MVKLDITPFKDFFSSKSAGGIILLVCVVISLIIANTGAGEGFENLLAAELGRDFGIVNLRYPVLLWINDGLMAIFFLLVGLEIKRELVEGELSSAKQAALPVFAAVGGMLVPALIFGLFNNNTPTSGGWGIPMATDIAFAIAILSLLGDRVPLALKIFLTALAIVDDLGAILVIAIFYSSEIHLDYLAYGGGVFIYLIVLNRMKVMGYGFYLIPGLFMWYFIHHSGIHATIAGVLTALTIPTTPDQTESPLEKLEHVLTRPVNFIIMPLFALANTNIRFEEGMIDGLYSNMGMGIIFGLLLGKPIGIVIMSWVSVKTGLSALPKKTKWIQIAALGVIAGIGFTMSIFMAMLSYSQPELQTEAKFSILVASVIAGVTGYTLLRVFYKRV
ncbi:Na+/H+ antiporter NhaA [Daejeonella lutea]|uniref:Na(+)/H(+) antiporter NhaA n=1 Tax=Daejeonella lutea TaxID=572036 RepID=A0A1T5ANL1_9SPHI|nr:Na+/H+ antiporter NhaA [Daejeonella lutea]SKB36578.1 Na+:H+ antiporter, NhaA family [Daejeonella lutea]